MAVTVHVEPKPNTPCWNDQWFVATSTQTAQPNFQFYVQITVHYHNGTTYTTASYTEYINNPPDNNLRFNARSYAEPYCKHFIPLNGTGWYKCLNGVLKIVVNIGERYGTTPVDYAGSNKTYYVWNAAFDSYMFAPVTYTASSYINATYLCNNGSPFNILNDFPETRTTSGSQNFLYLMASADNVIKKMIVTSNDGQPIPFTASFTVNNPYYNTGNWYDRYVCVRVDPTYLAAAGGANWVAVDGTTYTVDLYDNTDTLQKTLTFTYDNMCSKFRKYQLTYLNKRGAFDYFYFNMLSDESYNIKRTNVGTNIYSGNYGATTQEYYIYSQSNKVLTTSVDKKLKLNSEPITETQSGLLLDLISSPVVYIHDLDAGSSLIYAVNVNDSTYKRLRNFNGKVFNLLANIDFSQTSFRQKGA